MTNEEALHILDTIPTIGEQVDALEMAIKALEAKSYKSEARRWKRRYLDLQKKTEEQRPKGRWIQQEDIHKHHYGWLFCSECGAFLMSADGANYCSCCGAKMEVDE